MLRKPRFVGLQEKYEYSKLSDIPEKYREFMRLYRAVPQDEKKFKKYVAFIKKYQRLPRATITKDGKRLSWSEITPEELEEVKLYHSWSKSKERTIVQSFSEIPLEKVPAKYRKYISIIREFTESVKIDNFFEEFVTWLETHQDDLPRKFSEIRNVKDEKQKKYEGNLRKAWDSSDEKKVLKEFKGKPLEAVPEEYRKKIAILRNSWLELTEDDKEQRFFDFLEKSNGELPKQYFKNGGTIIKKKDLSIEQYREIRLRQYWDSSKIKKTLEQYLKQPIENIPEEVRGKIQILRNYGLEKERKIYGDIYEEIIEWLQNHKGIFPNSFFPKDPDIKRGTRNVQLRKYSELTDEEKAEVSLSSRWYRSEERATVIKYKGVPLEEIPEADRNVVQRIRKIAVCEPGTVKRREPLNFEEYVDWLKAHNSQRPRGKMYIEGRVKRTDELTPEEFYERELCRKWEVSKERDIYIEFYNTPLEQIPEEHREKIEILRFHGITIRNRDGIIKRKMRKTLHRRVGDNEEVRNELNSELMLEIPEEHSEDGYPDFNE